MIKFFFSAAIVLISNLIIAQISEEKRMEDGSTLLCTYQNLDQRRSIKD